MNKRIQRSLAAGFVILAAWGAACRRPSPAPSAAAEADGGTNEAKTVALSPQAIATAGIETAAAEARTFTATIHVPGEIKFNPRRTAHVAARSSGRIEKLAAYQGDRVAKGQALALLYSQDFLSLQAELLQALARSKRAGPEAAEREASKALLESARNRIRLLDVPEDVLAGIERSGAAAAFLEIRAPLAGSVIESFAESGDYVEAGAGLFRLSDLSTVRADLRIFEKDLSAVGPGSGAVIRTAAFPDRSYSGRIFQMGSVVDEGTRTVEARIELANPSGDLRPGLFIEGDIRASGSRRAVGVPSAAILEFKEGRAVFVRAGENLFILREVATGTSSGGWTEILSGIETGETVVSRGSFFLKSELLKGSLEEE